MFLKQRSVRCLNPGILNDVNLFVTITGCAGKTLSF